MDEKLIKLAVDGYHGHLGEYSVKDSQEVLRQAMIEANNGKTSMNYKDIRDGKCSNLFAITEVLIDKVSEEGLKGDEFFTNFIEDRNTSLGDTNIFHTTKPCLLTVADIAEGTQGIRRQRLEAGQDITVNTQLRAVKVYEEINRVLAGRIDFNDLVDTVGRSFTQYDLDSAYLAWTSMFTKLDPVYTQSGSYNEDKLLDLIEHIEASTGDTATIVGTRKALRKITTATMGEQAKSDLYSMGYLGHIAGTPMVAMKQRHKIGSTEFILPDDTVYIFAGENVNSVGTLVTIGKSRAFLAGDINYKAGDEKRIADKIGNVDLLKVGHHGYLYSTSFYWVKKLMPKIAIFCNEMKGVYPDVKYKLKNISNSKLYATMNSNGIIACFDGENIVVKENIM